MVTKKLLWEPDDVEVHARMKCGYSKNDHVTARTADARRSPLEEDNANEMQLAELLTAATADGIARSRKVMIFRLCF